MADEKECLCSGCIDTDGVLDNGYCEDCFDQGCDNGEDNH